ncbi:MAG: LamG-like jellyroll fold domain-containing protein [Bacteroidales bacterium]
MTKFFYYLSSFLSSVLLTIAFVIPTNSFSQRTAGPILLYTFSEVENDSIIKDMSDVEPIVDLRMTKEVQKIEGSNGVIISDDQDSFVQGLFSYGDPPAGISEKIKASGAFTYEAWLRPASSTLGECRIISYSGGSASRNASLLIKLTNVEIRTRTVNNGNNGYLLPWLIGPIITEDLPVVHFVYTFDGGAENFYVDGSLFNSRTELDDNIQGWDSTFTFIIGTELNNDAVRRQYKGEIYLVAVYDKALTPDEVSANFDAGHEDSQEVNIISSNEYGFNLGQNYPNPFSSTTTIAFNIPIQSDVNITLFDVLGKEVRKIASGSYGAGSHKVNFNATGLSPGGYFYKIEAAPNSGRGDDFVNVKHMILIK